VDAAFGLVRGRWRGLDEGQKAPRHSEELSEVGNNSMLRAIRKSGEARAGRCSVELLRAGRDDRGPMVVDGDVRGVSSATL
jgi:hypothetical protein